MRRVVNVDFAIDIWQGVFRDVGWVFSSVRVQATIEESTCKQRELWLLQVLEQEINITRHSTN
jgi:hypothetical protein